jgi:hypothetical protein
MLSMSRRHRLIVMGVLAALVCSCAGGCASRTATVTGRVTYRGKPVTNGCVLVYCSDKQIARGNIGADGTYSIPNVPVGSSAVTVQSHARVPAGLRLPQNLPPSSGGPIAPIVEHTDTQRISIPQRYALPEESGLSVVVEDGPVTFDIDLKP